jgi:hypothetical protein
VDKAHPRMLRHACGYALAIGTDPGNAVRRRHLAVTHRASASCPAATCSSAVTFRSMLYSTYARGEARWK